MNFQNAPAGLGLNSEKDDGKFVAGARDGEEWTLRRPGGNGRASHEPGNGEALGQQTEFETTSRRGHGELEETPHKAIVHGRIDCRRRDRSQSSPIAILNTWRSFLDGMDGAPQKLPRAGSPSFWSRARIQVRRRSGGIGNADIDVAEA